MLNKSLLANKISTQIIVPEAATLTALYEGKGPAARQIQSFYSKTSPYYLGNFKQVKQVIEGHSYFTDLGDTTLIKVRKQLKDTAANYKIPFWQSEYSMLGNGYKEGAKGKISAIDCALFLSKIIYHDLAIANATAWHLWNSWEPGSTDFDTRYYLLALKNNRDNTEGDFTITKNLWALGHYSRFIRPGMKRINVERNDGLNDIQIAQNIMLTAFTDQHKTIIVAINYTHADQELNLKITGFKKIKKISSYTTTAKPEDNMKPAVLRPVDKIKIQPRSISTFILE